MRNPDPPPPYYIPVTCDCGRRWSLAGALHREGRRWVVAVPVEATCRYCGQRFRVEVGTERVDLIRLDAPRA